jgi:hypothetical protein
MVSATYTLQVQTSAGPYRQAAETPASILSYWRLSEGTVSYAAVDRIGSHNGTYVGSPTVGVPNLWIDDGNYAVSFDGVNDTVTMGDVAAFRFTGAFTISCWVRYTVAAVGGIVTKTESVSVGARGWGLQVTAAGKIQFFAFTAANAQVFNITTPLAHNNGLWHHVMATWDGTTTADKVIIYVDGVSVITGTAAAGTISTAANPFRIGARGVTASEFYTGTIDEVSVYGAALPASDASSVTGLYSFFDDWVSTYNTDVLIGQPILLTRGIPDSEPTSRVATIGVGEFSWQNGTNNAAGLLGYYSQDNAHFNGVTTFGRRVRWLATYAGVDYVLWTGRIRTLAIEPSVHGMLLESRPCHVTAHDAIGDLAGFTVREVAPQINQTETTLIQTVVTALGAILGIQTMLDDAKETYPYSLDDLGKAKGNALSVLYSLAISAWGLSWADVYNVVRYRNRTTQATKAGFPTATLTENEVDEWNVRGSREQAYTRVLVTVHPRRVDAAATTVLCSGAGQLVPANSTVDFFLDYVDPAQKAQVIGAIGQVTPLTTPAHYLANAAADGSGANLTANISIVTTAFSSAAKFVITNSGGTDAYMTLLQKTQFFENSLEIDMPYQTNGIVAGSSGSNIADFLQAAYSSKSLPFDEVSFSPHRSATLMAYALTVDVGDVVTVSESVGGLSILFIVVAVIHEIASGVLRTRWRLALSTNTY